MESWSWKPSNTQIAVAGITLTTVAVIHYVYGIRFRWTKLSQSAITPQVQDNEPLLSISMMRETPKIKILSQNIWCVHFKGGSQRNKRLQILIGNIKNDNPDIICLQEMHLLGIGFLLLCGDYLYVQNHLIKQGYIYHTDPKLSTPYFGSSSGCIIFSKYPIIGSKTNIFNNRRFGRCKGWIYAHISIPNIHDLFIINTHLEHKNKNIQFGQMKEISNDINNNILNDKYVKNKDNSSILCMGDFNVCSNHSYGDNGYDLLCEQMKIVGLNIDLYNKTERTYSKLKQRRGTESLDHLFINDECKQYVDKCHVVDYRNKQRIMSDHLGLLTTFQFK